MLETLIQILKAILFGVVEGITEWLPISSTGHLIILEGIIDVGSIYDEAFWDLFLVVIQLGAILAVIIHFFNKLNPFFGSSLINSNISKTDEEKKNIWLLWLKVIVACIPAGVIGLVFDDLLDKYLYNSIVVSITLILYGAIFIILELRRNKKIKISNVNAISFKRAFLIGCFQVLALIPGTSRSGVTILGAMLLMCSRESASEFSFFVSVPVMLGASILKIVKFFMDNSLNNGMILFMLVGLITAFSISLLTIKFLMSFVKRHDFKIFGVYRIILGIILIVLFSFGILRV